MGRRACACACQGPPLVNSFITTAARQIEGLNSSQCVANKNLAFFAEPRGPMQHREAHRRALPGSVIEERLLGRDDSQPYGRHGTTDTGLLSCR